jgi:hypothetical protein
MVFMDTAKLLKIANDNLSMHESELEAALCRGFTWGGDTIADLAAAVDRLQEEVTNLQIELAVELAGDRSVEVHLDF